MRDASGTLRTIQRIRGRDATNTLRTLWEYLSLVLSHTSISKVSSGPVPSGTVTSGVVSSILTGGVAPVTYLWVGQDGDEIVADTPTADNTTFTATCYEGIAYVRKFTLVGTDATGATASADVNVTLRWVDTS